MDQILRAYIVTTEPPRIAGKESVRRRWAVLAENVEAAVDLVRERVAPECVVEAASEIGLKPNHAAPL
jgi:hypothetical protein